MQQVVIEGEPADISIKLKSALADLNFVLDWKAPSVLMALNCMSSLRNILECMTKHGVDKGVPVDV